MYSRDYISSGVPTHGWVRAYLDINSNKHPFCSILFGYGFSMQIPELRPSFGYPPRRLQPGTWRTPDEQYQFVATLLDRGL